MTIDRALRQYAHALESGRIHAYLTNACYDSCAHCYISAVAPKSCKATYLPSGDLLHFTNLFHQDKKNMAIGLSGGDPLLHPEIQMLLTGLSSLGRLDILTSGFALSQRNPRRKELLEALVKSKANILMATPETPYHSIDKQTLQESIEFIKKEGYNPKRLGYNAWKEESELAMWILNPIISLISYFIRKHSEEKDTNKEPPAMPIGRAANFPEGKKLPGVSWCAIMERTPEIIIGYQGNLQYCMYSCHDGFMNISELRGINNKEEAKKYILSRLQADISAQDMIQYQRCYFSRKIRKKQEHQGINNHTIESHNKIIQSGPIKRKTAPETLLKHP